MGYTYDKRRTPTAHSRTRQTANAPEQGMTFAAMPNSARLALMGLDNEGARVSNLGDIVRSRVAHLRRIAEIPAAEREADNLSKGVTGTTPEQVKQEMGERLGSDFSSVCFHSDSSSVAQADSMGARAWAQGNDVYFGKGGFSPDVAAHELVHTVQQGGISGNVSQSVPLGTIQMVKSKRYSKRLRRMGIKEINPQSKYKRPWTMSRQELENNQFNPGNIDLLNQVQKKIDEADSVNEAYKVFSRFAGNSRGKLVAEDGKTAWNAEGVNKKLFSAKLKHMIRMVFDYPQLYGRIGNMKELNDPDTDMSAAPCFDTKEKSLISYNKDIDMKNKAGQIKRQKRAAEERKTKHSAANTHYDGVHELAHVLNSLILKGSRANKEHDWRYNITANRMVKRALRKTHPRLKQIKYKIDYVYNDDDIFLKGQLNPRAIGLKSLRVTSGYGASNCGELFAEAFADVYKRGADAKPLHKAIVKEYEKKAGYSRKRTNILISNWSKLLETI